MYVDGWKCENVNVHVFIFDVIVYIARHLPLTHLLGITVQFNKFYSILFPAQMKNVQPEIIRIDNR